MDACERTIRAESRARAPLTEDELDVESFEVTFHAFGLVPGGPFLLCSPGSAYRPDLEAP